MLYNSKTIRFFITTTDDQANILVIPMKTESPHDTNFLVSGGTGVKVMPINDAPLTTIHHDNSSPAIFSSGELATGHNWMCRISDDLIAS